MIKAISLRHAGPHVPLRLDPGGGRGGSRTGAIIDAMEQALMALQTPRRPRPEKSPSAFRAAFLRRALAKDYVSVYRSLLAKSRSTGEQPDIELRSNGKDTNTLRPYIA